MKLLSSGLWSRYSSVCIETGYGVVFPAGANYFTVIPISGAHPASYPMGTGR
jgi:hypothetical protein